ncbi:MAG: hypothetical protein O7C63_06175, partial [Alphaproteobacteria bacterium]|nr:hypothetical protein [Alphaproteobacteria bacterium]
PLNRHIYAVVWPVGVDEIDPLPSDYQIVGPAYQVVKAFTAEKDPGMAEYPTQFSFEDFRVRIDLPVRFVFLNQRSRVFCVHRDYSAVHRPDIGIAPVPFQFLGWYKAHVN